jgi:hypothetical protein
MNSNRSWAGISLSMNCNELLKFSGDPAPEQEPAKGRQGPHAFSPPAIMRGRVGSRAPRMWAGEVKVSLIIQAAVKAVPTIGKAGRKIIVPLGTGAVLAVAAAVKGGFDTKVARKLRKDALKELEAAIVSALFESESVFAR